jgi:hypothetical protein
VLTARLLDDLEESLSKNRLEFWTAKANNNRQRGLLLHRRNTLIASALFADLQVLEIALRNALDRELQKKYPPDWLNDARFRDRDDVKSAKDLARKIHGSSASRHDKILVCLQFSFWVKLLKGRAMQDKMREAFRPSTDIENMHIALEQLLDLRNAMAHHEPILDGTREHRTLGTDLTRLDQVLKAICPATAEWLHGYSWIRPIVEKGLGSCVGDKSHRLTIVVP